MKYKSKAYSNDHEDGSRITEARQLVILSHLNIIVQ